MISRLVLFLQRMTCMYLNQTPQYKLSIGDPRMKDWLIEWGFDVTVKKILLILITTTPAVGKWLDILEMFLGECARSIVKCVISTMTGVFEYILCLSEGPCVSHI